jgi:hypothetical protein
LQNQPFKPSSQSPAKAGAKALRWGNIHRAGPAATTCQAGPNMIVLAPVRRHQWDERERPTMPSLLRFLSVVAILAAIVYGGIYALAHFVEPRPREISVSIPPEKFFKNR